MLGEEMAELDAHLPVFRGAAEAAVGHGFPDMELGLDPGLAQSAVEGTAELVAARVPAGCP